MSALSSVLGNESDVLTERQFQLLLIANVLPPLGTAVLSPVLDSLIDPFGASAANIGLMMSAFTAPAIVMIPIAGVLADRYGRKPVLLFGLLCFGASGTAIALTTEFRIALLLRLIQGIGFSALTPIIITSIGDLYSGSKEATAQGLRFTGSGISQTIFPLAAGVIVVAAWQYPFLLYAIAFPIAIVTYLWLEEPVDPESDPLAEEGRSVRGQLRQLLTLVAHRRAAAMVVARGLTSVIWLGFLTYNSIIVVQLMDGTPAQAGVLAALGSTSYAAAATQSGRITERFESRLYPLIAMNVAFGVGMSAVFLATALWMALLGIVLMGAGFGILLSLYRSIITSLAPPSLRGGLVSLAEGSGRVAATVTPIVMGVLIATLAPRLGFEAAVRTTGLIVSVVAMGGGILCLLVVSRAPPISLEE